MPTSLGSSYVCAATAALMMAGSGLAQQFEVLRKSPIRGNSPAVIDEGIVADVDGNGTLDILQRSGSMLTNDGNLGFDYHPPGTRIPWNSLQLGSRFQSAADVDGDGHLDLIVSSLSFFPLQGEFFVMFGAGNGTWGNAQLMGTAAGITTLSFVEDVNGDGAPDLICGAGATAALLLNNGGMGGFADVTASNMPASQTGRPVAIEDFDGDGDLDIVTAGVGLPMQLLQNDGTGQFQVLATSGLPTYSQYRRVAAGDADGDGDIDLMVSAAQVASLQLLINDGSGGFSLLATTLQTNTSEFAFEDLDGDGDADLLVLEVTGSPGAYRILQLYRNLAPGQFSPALFAWAPLDERSSMGAPVLADLDGDGDRDVVVGGSYLFLDDGTQSYTPLQRNAMPLAEFMGTVLPGDFDGDGDADVVVGTTVAHNGGDGFFEVTPMTYPIPSQALARALVDVDNDGDLDVIFTENPAASPGAGSGALLNQNGDLTSFMPIPVAQLSGDVIARDFDGDGFVDLYSQAGLVLQNTGGGNFAPVAMTPIGVNRPATAADFNNDGSPDLAVADSQGWSLYYNVGGLQFQQVASIPSPVPVEMGSADFDGDGQVDVMVRVGSSGYGGGSATMQAWMSQGGQFVGGSSSFGYSHLRRGLVFADVDEDGDVDMISDDVRINDGAGNFAALSSDVIGAGAIGVADVDRDGDLDIIATRGSGVDSAAHVLVNRHRHLATPRMPVIGQPLTIEMAVQPGYGGGGHLVVPALAAQEIPPVAIPGLGLLRIDPLVATFGAIGITDADGEHEQQVTVPNSVLLVGRDLFWQGVVLEPNGLRLTGLVHDVVIH